MVAVTGWLETEALDGICSVMFNLTVVAYGTGSGRSDEGGVKVPRSDVMVIPVTSS